MILKNLINQKNINVKRVMDIVFLVSITLFWILAIFYLIFGNPFILNCLKINSIVYLLLFYRLYEEYL